MIRLDSNAAWKEASALVAANREVLFVVAGVFFLLPNLLMSVVLGEPQIEPGSGSEQVARAMMEYYTRGWWLILLTAVFQIIGMLTVLTLMRDRRRPTVAEAITAGVVGFPSYFAAQLLFVIGASLAGGVLGVVIAAIGGAALGAVLLMLLLLGIGFVAVRLMLAAPVIAVDGERNPLTALARSWQLTRNNFWRIFAFFLLVGLLFVVALAVIMILVGIVLALLSQGEVQRVLASVVSSTLVSLAMLYFLGMLAAVHRQLSRGATGSGVQTV
ncbi:MAG: glycerophosphoryl diester phosphodiesterase membrane domain-containing protein [Novosphingobium sp.]